MKTKKPKTPKKLNTLTGEEFKLFKKKLDDSAKEQRKAKAPKTVHEAMMLDDISKLAKHGERNTKPINYLRADGSQPLSKEHRKLYANRLYVANNRNLVVEIKAVAGVNGGETAYLGYIWHRVGDDRRLTVPLRMSWSRDSRLSVRCRKHPHGFHFKSDTNDPAFFIVDDAMTNDLATELFRKIEEEPELDVQHSAENTRYECWSIEELLAEASIAWFRRLDKPSEYCRVLTVIDDGDGGNGYVVEFSNRDKVHSSELASKWEYKYFSYELSEKDPWKPCVRDTTPDEGDC